MTDRPVRIRLSRAKGWRLPPNTVKVDRTTRWGNPYYVERTAAGWGVYDALDQEVGHRADREGATRLAVNLYRTAEGTKGSVIAAAQGGLKGKNLACWCALDAPCHADVLLELANR